MYYITTPQLDRMGGVGSYCIKVFLLMRNKFLLIEGCDFVDYPTGGQLSFARQMMRTFGNRLALVGISTDDTPVGVWLKKH